GTRLVTTDGFEVIAYPTDRDAYGRLCRLLTQGNIKAKKGECHIDFDGVLAASEGQMLIVLPPDGPGPLFIDRLPPLRHAALRCCRPRRRGRAAPRPSSAPGGPPRRGREPRRLARLDALGERVGAPLVAVNDVHYHAPDRRPLADVVTCIREKCTIHEAGL